MLYPSIETLFTRDFVTHKLIPGEYKKEVFSLIKEWEWTEKIDGTNIRVMYDCGKEFPSMTIGGRTENAQLPMGVVDYIQGKLNAEKLHETFEKSVVIFGEGYGDKIQEGSGYIHPDDPVRQKFIVFDICVGGKYWLQREDVVVICESLGLDVVPLVEHFFDEDEIFYTLRCIENAVARVKTGFKSKLGDGTKDAEGLVGRTKIPLYYAKHRRVIAKIRTEDFVGKKGKTDDNL